MELFDGKLDSAKMDFLWWIFLMEKMIVQKWISFDGFFWWNFLIVQKWISFDGFCLMEFFDSAKMDFLWWIFLMEFFDSAKMDFLWWIFLMEFFDSAYDGAYEGENDDAMMENNDVMNDGEIWW